MDKIELMQKIMELHTKIRELNINAADLNYDLTAKKNAEVRAMKMRHEREISDLKDAYTAKFNEVRVQHHKEKDVLIDELHALELELAKIEIDEKGSN